VLQANFGTGTKNSVNNNTLVYTFTAELNRQWPITVSTQIQTAVTIIQHMAKQNKTKK
jgi:hypothetical protein